MYPFEIATASKSENNFGQEIEGAFLYYEFREDGTYIKAFGSNNEKVEETGKWNLSDNGSILFLHPSNDCQAQSQQVNIKHLQLDELVLEQSLNTRNTNFCTGLKDFYFNKQ